MRWILKQQPEPTAEDSESAGSRGVLPPAPGCVDDAIGGTPLVALKRITPPDAARVCVKLESANPGGSVKDRAARAIILAAEGEGRLHAGKTLLDASSGNTGIAYAMLCAARGYHCEICLPATASPERRALMRRYGADVVETDPVEGSDGAIREARRRAAEDPDRYFYADQYNNAENWLAHYSTTGPEIWRQTGGAVTHWVVILGTTGSFIGTGRRLKELDPRIRLIAAQPASPFHGIEGAKHLQSAIVPGIYDPDLPDETVWVTTEEAQEMALRLAREEGLLAGVSGGANVAAALRVGAGLPSDACVVTLLPDGGERYLSAPWWECA